MILLSSLISGFSEFPLASMSTHLIPMHDHNLLSAIPRSNLSMLDPNYIIVYNPGKGSTHSPLPPSLPPLILQVIETKVAEFNATETTDGAGSSSRGAQGGSSTSAGAAVGAAPPIPYVPVPRVDPLYLQQLCDMGFARDHSEEALLACGNDLSAAMEWILSHPPSTSAEVQLLSYSDWGF